MNAETDHIKDRKLKWNEVTLTLALKLTLFTTLAVIATDMRTQCLNDALNPSPRMIVPALIQPAGRSPAECRSHAHPAGVLPITGDPHPKPDP